MRDFCGNCMTESDLRGGVCSNCGFRVSEYRIDPHHLAPGTVLKERYRVGRVLGEGGFGITYVGLDTVLDLKVAVKEFYLSGYVSRNNAVSAEVHASANPETFERNREKFLQEAKVLARFSTEPGIVCVRDFFRENNTAYIVMEFLEGETLYRYLRRVGRLSWQETWSLLEPVLESLGSVHSHNLIHRDISPDNIMMVKKGKMKLLDFGAAREYSADDPRSLSVVLKKGYAPLEQHQSKGVQGPWTDVYALCATMYRCLTGKVPEDAMDRVFEDGLKPPAAVCGCPQAISDVLMKGLSVRVEHRYQSVEALSEAIRAANSERKLGETAAEPEEKTRTSVAEEPTTAAEPRYEPVAAREIFRDAEIPEEVSAAPDDEAAEPEKPAKLLPRIVLGLLMLLESYYCITWFLQNLQ